MKLVQEAYEKSHRTYGYRQITTWLQRHQGVCINHKTVLRLTLTPGASVGVYKLNIRSVVRKRIGCLLGLGASGIVRRTHNTQVMNLSFAGTG